MSATGAVYLDHAATTPLAPEVLAAMLPLLQGDHGNPSSAHTSGRRARAAVDEARERVAAVLRCLPAEVVFTSGGSESDNLALRGALERDAAPGRHLVVSAIEHDAVLKTAEALAARGRAEVTVVPCDGRGVVDPERLAAAARPDTACVSLMLVNNEVGTVQDVAAAAAAVRARAPRALVHSDAVQGLGRLPLDMADLGVDLLTVTAHKVYGPQGVGALFIRRGATVTPQVTGGGQERGRRSGTENVAGIAGFGVAATLVEGHREAEMTRLAPLSDRLRERVLGSVPDAVVTAAGAPRLPSFATFAFPGVETEVLVAGLDGEGVEVSGGSACSSGAHMPSHVLAAMGLPPALAAGALRCTLGRATTAEGVDRAAAAIASCVARVREALAAGAPRG